MAATIRAAAARGDQASTNAIIVLAETNQLVTGSGRLMQIIGIAVGTAFRVEIYDATSGTSNKIYDYTAGAIGEIKDLDLPFQEGLRVISTGIPGQINVSYNPN